MAIVDLSIRLLKPRLSIDDSLRPDARFEEQEAEGGRLFVVRSFLHPPKWVTFVRSFSVADLEDLGTASCGAVLFLHGHALTDVQGQEGVAEVPFTCAISFGTGHHGLRSEAFERSFGLRVVLNAVTRTNLRGLDTATLDATTVQRRIQTSRNADLQIFGLDFERDLLRLASGIPTDPTFAKSLAGKDALTIHRDIRPAELQDCCRDAVSLFHKQTYRNDFGFIDHIVPVTDGVVARHLDAQAFAELRELVNGGVSDLHIALPDVLSPESGYDIAYYGIGLRPGPKTIFNGVAIEDYISELQAGRFDEITDMQVLRLSHEIRAVVEGNVRDKHSRRLHTCFVCEVEYEDSRYILYEGEWYQVERSFYEDVVSSFRKLVSQPFVTQTHSLNERAFIAELEVNEQLLNLDQLNLSPAGASGANFEPCDFFSRSRQFIHLKDGHDSAPISHLWNQGAVATEAFIRDAEYRANLRRRVQQRQQKRGRRGFDTLLPIRRNKPSPADFTVVFGILRRPYARSRVVDLPFFSKVSLRAIAARIQSMGFRVEVHLIAKIPAH